MLECFIVVNIGQVEQLPTVSNITGNALGSDGQFKIATAVEPGFDLGDDGALILSDRVERQSVGIEELADILAGLKHDLLKVVRLMDPGGDLLQLLVKKQLESHAALFRRQLL